jgi:hypothetical protein
MELQQSTKDPSKPMKGHVTYLSALLRLSSSLDLRWLQHYSLEVESSLACDLQRLCMKLRDGARCLSSGTQLRRQVPRL